MYQNVSERAVFRRVLGKWGKHMAKKRMQVFRVMPGTKLLEDVYYNNELIISKDTILNENMILHLKRYGIYQVMVEVEDDNDEEDFREAENNDIYSQRAYELKKSKEFQKFEKTFAENIAHVEKIFLGAVSNEEEIRPDILLEQVDELLSNGRNGLHIIEMMNCVKQYDDITFAHCLNVGMLSNVIGKWLGKSTEELQILTLAGILHDIGKLMIPAEIIDKKGKLTEEEYTLVKTHPKHGYNILKNQNLDERVKNAALMHHERMDGSGYPMRLNKNSIENFAKIVSIADVYDAMTATRSYRKGMCPFKAISIMEEDGFQKYDAEYLLTFLQNTAEAYINMPVRMSDDTKGKIIKINPCWVSKPLVLTEKGFVDLSENRELTIQEIIV